MSSEAPSLVVAFVLDESGSMCGQTSQTINGVNQYLDDLRKDNEGKKVLFSLTKFTGCSQILHAAELLEDIPNLNHETYRPNGSTALLDAVGETITELETRIDKNIPALVVILTDGEENSSRNYNYDQIRELIESKKELGWSFVFLGAGEDAWATGQVLGTQSSMSFDAQSMGSTMRSISAGTKSYTEAYTRGLCGADAAMAFDEGYSSVLADKDNNGRDVDMEMDSVLDSTKKK